MPAQTSDWLEGNHSFGIEEIWKTNMKVLNTVQTIYNTAGCNMDEGLDGGGGSGIHYSIKI